MTNLVVLRGRLTRPAAVRALPSGDELVELEVSVPRPGQRAESAPVVWPDAPAAARELDVDEEVVVVGRVRRRFFRAGGATQSRTEVVAEAVVPAARARRARAVVGKALARLDAG
ncbi:MAG: single-stranded DNA-binding protein [Acidimicrobiia bacterium]